MKKMMFFDPKDSISSLFDKYDSCKQLCTLSPVNSFVSNQIDLIFNCTNGMNEYLYSNLCHRHDYVKNQNVHIITNQLTNAIYKCTVNEYMIEIESHDSINAFIEILYQKKRNYVIIHSNE